MIQTFPPVYSVPEARRPSRRQATPLLAGLRGTRHRVDSCTLSTPEL